MPGKINNNVNRPQVAKPATKSVGPKSAHTQATEKHSASKTQDKQALNKELRTQQQQDKQTLQRQNQQARVVKDSKHDSFKSIDATKKPKVQTLVSQNPESAKKQRKQDARNIAEQISKGELTSTDKKTSQVKPNLADLDKQIAEAEAQLAALGVNVDDALGAPKKGDKKRAKGLLNYIKSGQAGVSGDAVARASLLLKQVDASDDDLVSLNPDAQGELAAIEQFLGKKYSQHLEAGPQMVAGLVEQESTTTLKGLYNPEVDNGQGLNKAILNTPGSGDRSAALASMRASLANNGPKRSAPMPNKPISAPRNPQAAALNFLVTSGLVSDTASAPWDSGLQLAA